jgi:hypothetical protein
VLLPAVKEATAAAAAAAVLTGPAADNITAQLDQQVSWLVEHAPAVLQGDSLTAIMHVPNIPAAVAEVLVR